MRAVIQRVSEASVSVEGRVIGQVGRGLLILLAIHQEDHMDKVPALAKKIANLRIFQDEQGKMNRSLCEIQGGALVISQFTLYGDCSSGRRPSFIESASPELARALYSQFIIEFSKMVQPVEQGEFGAYMQVSLVNDGPVTLILDH